MLEGPWRGLCNSIGKYGTTPTYTERFHVSFVEVPPKKKVEKAGYVSIELQ
jgi:hypothetical protein